MRGPLGTSLEDACLARHGRGIMVRQVCGAEDAWYSSGIELESAILSGQRMVGGTLDLFKCCDQIARPLLYSLLALAGCPKHIMLAYINYHELPLLGTL